MLFDALFSWPLLNAGGLVIFDDYGWRPDLSPAKRPAAAIDIFLTLKEAELELLQRDHQVIVKKLSA